MIMSATRQFSMGHLEKLSLASPSRTDVVDLNGAVRRTSVKGWVFSRCAMLILAAPDKLNFIINVSGLLTSKGPKAHS